MQLCTFAFVQKKDFMKRLVLLGFIVISSVLSTNAQDFDMAVGGRLGVPFGVSFKKFINETDAIDITMGFSGAGVGTSLSILGQYQRHADIDFEDVENLQWFYGLAVSGNRWGYVGHHGVYVGGHAAFGLSYTLEDYPINLSIETNPGLFLGLSDRYNKGLFLSYYSGICGRFILN